ncbi:S-adenosyl-L-methionine-dependent methyltransferase [Xylaria telfairii]|nr:S-adenosyl-L-methionine-dependent methyltransferase [Xylaria telfairii]
MSQEERETPESHKARKKSPRKKRNPIANAIGSWYVDHAAQLKNQEAVEDLIAQAPKRWTAYGRLALLPAGSFTSATWLEVLTSTADKCPPSLELAEERTKGQDEGPTLLWNLILAEISRAGGTKVTHLGVNEGIPLHSATEPAAGGESENILRSPSGLRMLYGDFGAGGEEGKEPTADDFARAFWVSTKQNGITQMWAPRWTMFSRGNVKEKARVLRFHEQVNLNRNEHQNQDGDGNESEHLSHRHIPAPQRASAIAVDLYAGIGYFAFSYAAAGFGRVFCWELNAWSVEGLRRGAVANGWSVRVVVPAPSQEEDDVLQAVLAGDETIVVFLEDNARAAARLRRLGQLLRERDGGEEKGLMSRVMHVNLGLLPTSRGSWDTAWDVARETRLVWFHVHENVGVDDVDAMKEEVREWFAVRARALDEGESGGRDGVRTSVCVEHVELVKTFAPGVWHCVFDLCVKREIDERGEIT